MLADEGLKRACDFDKGHDRKLAHDPGTKRPYPARLAWTP